MLSADFRSRCKVHYFPSGSSNLKVIAIIFANVRISGLPVTFLRCTAKAGCVNNSFQDRFMSPNHTKRNVWRFLPELTFSRFWATALPQWPQPEPREPQTSPHPSGWGEVWSSRGSGWGHWGSEVAQNLEKIIFYFRFCNIYFFKPYFSRKI